jgi:heme oxygenase
MARLFEPSYTISEYRVHLGRLLGLFEPLERTAGAAADPADPVHFMQRSIALREDLEIMGDSSTDLGALEQCSWVPVMTRAGLPGYKYVILGSMLGGKIIASQLRSVLGPEASLRFYGDENGSSGALWASFRRELESTPTQDKETICSTAMNIFDLYAGWLSSPMMRSRRA